MDEYEARRALKLIAEGKQRVGMFKFEDETRANRYRRLSRREMRRLAQSVLDDESREEELREVAYELLEKAGFVDSDGELVSQDPELLAALQNLGVW